MKDSTHVPEWMRYILPVTLVLYAVAIVFCAVMAVLAL